MEGGFLTANAEDFASILSEVPGGAELVAWFGYAPGFHDAEILDLHLDRSGVSLLRLHTWRMTRDVDEKGYFILDKHIVVAFSLEKITALKPEGFSGQNVIYGLTLRRYGTGDEVPGTEFHTSAEPSPQDYGFILEPTYGLWGVIYARKISITLSPGKPVFA